MTSTVVDVRRARPEFKAAVYFAEMLRPTGLDERRIAAAIVAIARHSGWQAHAGVRLNNGFKVDATVSSSIYVLVRCDPRPVSIFAELKAAAAGGAAGIVLVSSLSDLRRVPAAVGLAPLAFVPIEVC